MGASSSFPMCFSQGGVATFPSSFSFGSLHGLGCCYCGPRVEKVLKKGPRRAGGRAAQGGRVGRNPRETSEGYWREVDVAWVVYHPPAIPLFFRIDLASFVGFVAGGVSVFFSIPVPEVPSEVPGLLNLRLWVGGSIQGSPPPLNYGFVPQGHWV